jgi:hypothetical protein
LHCQTELQTQNKPLKNTSGKSIKKLTMLSKKKLQELFADLKTLKVSVPQQAQYLNIGTTQMVLIRKGLGTQQQYAALIELRNTKKAERTEKIKELEAAI